MQCFVWVCKAFSDIGHVMPKIDWEISRRKRACTLLELKNMTTYLRPRDQFEQKMLCLFYFVLKSENTGIISRLQWYMRNNYMFPFYILSFLFQFIMSIDS